MSTTESTESTESTEKEEEIEKHIDIKRVTKMTVLQLSRAVFPEVLQDECLTTLAAFETMPLR